MVCVVVDPVVLNEDILAQIHVDTVAAVVGDLVVDDRDILAFRDADAIVDIADDVVAEAVLADVDIEAAVDIDAVAAVGGHVVELDGDAVTVDHRDAAVAVTEVVWRILADRVAADEVAGDQDVGEVAFAGGTRAIETDAVNLVADDDVANNLDLLDRAGAGRAFTGGEHADAAAGERIFAVAEDVVAERYGGG